MIRAAVLRAWCSHALRYLIALAILAAVVALGIANHGAPTLPMLLVMLGLVLFAGVICDPVRFPDACRAVASIARDLISAFRTPPNAGDPS